MPADESAPADAPADAPHTALWSREPMHRLAGTRDGGGSDSEDDALPELHRAPRSPNRNRPEEEDSDSDSDGGDLTVTPNAFELVSRDDVSHC